MDGKSSKIRVAADKLVKLAIEIADTPVPIGYALCFTAIVVLISQKPIVLLKVAPNI